MSGQEREVPQLIGRVRAQEWWDYKLLPIVQLFVATALTLRVPVGPLWPGLAALLIALIPGAAFASIVNDLTDRHTDRLAGRPNALDRWRWGPLLLGLCIAIGVFVVWQMRDLWVIFTVYVAAWLAFAAYSIPPLRLKARGGWGVISVAAGEAMLPSLLASLFAFHAAGTEIDGTWIAAVSIWALAHGTRSILWHQIADRRGDQCSQVRTFVVLHGAAATARLVCWFVLPVEIAALATMLSKIGGVLPWVTLAAYLSLVIARRHFWQNVPVAVMSVARHHLMLNEYYIGYLPITLLLIAGTRHVSDGLLLVPLLLLGRAPILAAIDAWRLSRLTFAACRHAR